MRKYNIGARLVKAIECLYGEATSAVLNSGRIREWFRTTAGVRQEQASGSARLLELDKDAYSLPPSSTSSWSES